MINPISQFHLLIETLPGEKITFVKDTPALIECGEVTLTTRTQVINHDDGVPLAEMMLREMGSNESCASGNEYMQGGGG